jgi:uncharacterized protein GlcG (DUF336 family)
VADSGGNLVAFEWMYDAMLGSINIAIHKAQSRRNIRASKQSR